MEPKIIFEDKSLVVIDKPPGMIVNDAATTSGIVTVQSWFVDNFKILSPNNQTNTNLEFYEKGGVVHRLDKDTSGVMVLAKTPAAYQNLKQQFLERKTTKKYKALVHGTFRDESGEVNQPIERHPKDRHKFGIGEDLSRTSITEWQVLQKILNSKFEAPNNTFSLMELIPHTGRTHQLRVHMQYLHHPIVADPIYGFKKTWQEDLVWCPRLFLHAYYLQITHPVTNKSQIFEIPLANDLSLVLENLIH